MAFFGCSLSGVKSMSRLIGPRHIRHMTGSTSETAKKAAAEAAVDRFILHDTKVIGIGSGSTVPHVIAKLRAKERDQKIARVYVPTSFQSRELILSAGLALGDVNQYPVIDVTIDGADEIDDDFNAIKGGGACHLQEKVIAEASKMWIIIAESRKKSSLLGTVWKTGIPIEVTPFAHVAVTKALIRLGAKSPVSRTLLGPRVGTGKAGPVVTDNGNFVIDAVFSPELMQKAAILATAIKSISGVIEVGLFCGLTHAIVMGYENGSFVIQRSGQKDAVEGH